jgi:hypothetical protein
MTAFELNSQGSDPVKDIGIFFATVYIMHLMPISIYWVLEALSLGIKDNSMKLTTQLHLV